MAQLRERVGYTIRVAKVRGARPLVTPVERSEV